MNNDVDEYLNVLSAVSFLENSERDYSMDIEDMREVGETSPDHNTTNLGGGDTINPVVARNGALNPTADTDNESVTERASSMSDFSNGRTSKASNSYDDNGSRTTLYTSKSTEKLCKKSSDHSYSRNKADKSDTGDSKDFSSDNEYDNTSQNSKSTLTSINSKIKQDRPALTSRKVPQAKRVVAQCKSYVNKGCHKLEYGINSKMTQPVVIKQKAQMKIQKEETIQLAPHTKRTLSVPTQLKAEALWHDNVLRLIVRGPANKLPPLHASNLHSTGASELPVDLELTFIPTHTRGINARPAKPVPKNNPTPPTSYKRRNPFVSKPKAKPAEMLHDSHLDRNIIANRAVGSGFITQITPQSQKDNRLPRVPQGCTNMTSSVHYSGSSITTASRPFINRTQNKYTAEYY